MSTIALLLLVICLLTLAVFGAGVFPWTVCVTAVLLSGAVCFCVGRSSTGPSGARAPWRWPLPAVFLAVLGFLLLTLLPLPVGLTALTGPGRHAQNRKVAETLQEADTLGLPNPGPVLFAMTRNRAGTMRTAVLAITMFGAALLASRLSAPQKTGFLRFLILLGTAIAAAGCVSLLYRPQGDTLWWVYPIPPGRPGPVACFINRNHFAGLLAMLSPVALALLADDLTARRFLRALLSAACFGLMSLALVLSLSRGGFVAYAAGLLAIPLTLLTRRRLLLVLLLLAATGALTHALVSRLPAARERLATLRTPTQIDSLQTRLTAWRDAVRVWRAYPVAGAGANAFRTVYTQHRTTSARAMKSHAENEYAQLLAEGGTAGVVLAAALLAALIGSARRGALSGASTVALRSAAAGAVAAAAVHAVVEFALRSPLYAVSLASIVGLILEVPPPARAGEGWPRAALCGLVAAAMLSTQWLSMGRMDATPYLQTAGWMDVRRALIWSPTAWNAWYNVGRQASRRGGSPAFGLGARCLTQATVCDPNNYRLWLSVGEFRLRIRDLAGARQAFDRARELRPWVDVPHIPEK